MIPNNYKDLVSYLYNKTINNECYWNRTSSLYQYKLIMNTGMIVLSYISQQTEEIFKLEIYNKNGIMIDAIACSRNIDSEDYEYLYSLYNAIYQQKDVVTNQQINDFIYEISNNQFVGKDEHKVTM